MEVKKIFKIVLFIIPVAGLVISLYWNYLTAARLDSLAQDILYFKQEYYEQQDKPVNAKPSQDIQINIPAKEPLADYSDAVKIDELNNRVNRLDNQSIFHH